MQRLNLILDSLKPTSGAQTAIARIDVAGTAANARVHGENVAAQIFTDSFIRLKIDVRGILVHKVNHIFPVT